MNPDPPKYLIEWTLSGSTGPKSFMAYPQLVELESTQAVQTFVKTKMSRDSFSWESFSRWRKHGTPLSAVTASIINFVADNFSLVTYRLLVFFDLETSCEVIEVGTTGQNT